MKPGNLSLQEDDRVPAPISRALLGALLLSALAHLLLCAYLLDRWDVGVAARHKPAVARSVELSLIKAAEPEIPPTLEDTGQRKDAGSPEAAATSHTAREKPSGNLQTLPEPGDDRAAQKPPRPTLKALRPRSFNLALPEMDPHRQSPPRPAGSSTIFDTQLQQTLAEARERWGAPESRPVLAEGNAGAFVGGRWQSLVKIGKLCFEVIEADPLDSMSTEQWYRRDCD